MEWARIADGSNKYGELARQFNNETNTACDLFYPMAMRPRISQQRGLTLIEILVSVGIIALVGIVISQGFFSIVRTNVKNELIKDVKENGDVALDVMTRMIRNSSSVTTTCSQSGTTTSSITILNPNGLSSTFTCALDSGIARIASVSASKTEYLTSRNVALGTNCTNALTFVCTSLANQKTSIKINFQLRQVGNSPDQFERVSDVFQSTVITRQ